MWRDFSREDCAVAQALFLSASLFNHGCDPNAHASFQLSSGVSASGEKASSCSSSNSPRGRGLTVRAVRPIRPGEQLLISYGPVVGSLQAELVRSTHVLEKASSFNSLENWYRRWFQICRL